MSIDPLGLHEVTAAIAAAFGQLGPTPPASPWFGEVFDLAAVYRVTLRGAPLRVEIGKTASARGKRNVLGVYLGVDAPDFRSSWR